MNKQWLCGVAILGLLCLSGCSGAPSESAQTAQAQKQVQPISLRDSEHTDIPVHADGVQLSALQIDDVTLLSCADVQKAFSWLKWSVDGEQVTLTDESGQTHVLPANDDSVRIIKNSDGSVSECWIDIQVLSDALSLRYLSDTENQTMYLSPKIDTTAIPSGRQVPVLMYHAVSDQTWGLEGLFLSPSDMEAQLKYLTENGYDPIFFSDLPHLNQYKKPVILTFDDGYNNNYTDLYPLLQKYNVKVTIFVIPASVGGQYSMTAAQIKEMSDSGLVSIQSHTQDHKELASLSADQQKQQFAQSQLAIARMTGRIPSVLSYPSGSYDGNTLSLAPEYFDMAVKSRGGLWTVQNNFFEIDRYPVYRDTGIHSFQTFIH